MVAVVGGGWVGLLVLMVVGCWFCVGIFWGLYFGYWCLLYVVLSLLLFVVWVVICLIASGDVWFGFTLWVCYCYVCGLGWLDGW